MRAQAMQNSHQKLPYVSVVASAVLGYFCLACIGVISNSFRGCIVAHRPDLALRAPTAFLITYWRTIRDGASVVALLILIGGVASVRLAAHSDQAMRRALRLSIFVSLFSSIALFAALACLFMSLVGGVIKGVDPHTMTPEQRAPARPPSGFVISSGPKLATRTQGINYVSSAAS